MMSGWLDNQKKRNDDFCQLLQERIDKANPRRELTAEATKRLHKSEAITDKPKCGGYVQSRQLQTWLS